ncbi:MAG: hypothetical protein JRJ82_07010 [Deltaproteobacteria bacterium]|nr:hypothetical protein [Deltaproteobacteria bacterium]
MDKKARAFKKLRSAVVSSFLADLAVEIADITVNHEEGKCIVRGVFS